MPLPSLASRRVVDPVLQRLYLGYENQEFIGNKICPPAPVTLRGGKVVSFDDSHMENDSYDRAAGAPYKVVHSSYSGVSYTLEQKGLMYPVPIEDQQESQDIGIDWDILSRDILMQRMMLEHENDVATLFTNDVNYSTGNKLTLSGTDQWNSGSADIPDQIRTAVTAIARETGSSSNIVMWMNRTVFDVMREDPVIKDNYKHTTAESVTTDMLARYFELAAIYVGSAVNKAQDDSKSFVWGDYVGLCKVNPAALANGGGSIIPNQNVSMRVPAFGYTYTYQENGAVHPLPLEVFWNETTRTWEYRVDYHRVPVLSGINSGYLLSDVLA